MEDIVCDQEQINVSSVSDSAPSMYYSTIMLLMPAVGKMQFLQWEPAASPSLAYIHMSWLPGESSNGDVVLGFHPALSCSSGDKALICVLEDARRCGACFSVLVY